MRKELRIFKNDTFKYGGDVSVELKEFDENGLCKRLFIKNGFYTKDDALKYINSEYQDIEVINEYKMED